MIFFCIFAPKIYNMKKNEFTHKSVPLIESMCELEANFESVISEYYKNAPNEKGKKKTIFYEEMISMIYSFESTVESMRMKLDNPDLISTIDMK